MLAAIEINLCWRKPLAAIHAQFHQHRIEKPTAVVKPPRCPRPCRPRGPCLRFFVCA